MVEKVQFEIFSVGELLKADDWHSLGQWPSECQTTCIYLLTALQKHDILYCFSDC